MFCTGQKKLKLLARNEGKLKTYESCFDVRAWSHDIEARDRYIRDWIKSDMPVCILPVRTVFSCLRTMTWRRGERSTPRCHPNCKSKFVLESICNSCHAMKECFKNDESFEKYFDEEDFETSHWPCEKCLDALKSIKMFWKIITEKIFRISIPRNDNFQSACSSSKSIQSVAKVWEEELVQQAYVVKNLTPLLKSHINEQPSYCWKSYTKYLKKIITLDNLRFVVDDSDDSTVDAKKSNETVKTYSYKDKTTYTDAIKPSTFANNKGPQIVPKKINKCTSFRVKTENFGNDACNINIDEVNIYKNNLDYLQQQYNMQNDELNQLKSENASLKLQLQSMTKKPATSYLTVPNADKNSTVVPIPYESYFEKEENVNNINSEMIITLKNCENENFKYVSMLQVLHKTNDLIDDDEHLSGVNNCKIKQDPIKILTKVHNTFGAIVQRELTIANQSKCHQKHVEIDASYQKVQTSRSVPSCSPATSQSSQAGIFVSTTEF